MNTYVAHTNVQHLRVIGSVPQQSGEPYLKETHKE